MWVESKGVRGGDQEKDQKLFQDRKGREEEGDVKAPPRTVRMGVRWRMRAVSIASLNVQFSNGTYKKRRKTFLSFFSILAGGPVGSPMEKKAWRGEGEARRSL